MFLIFYSIVHLIAVTNSLKRLRCLSNGSNNQGEVMNDQSNVQEVLTKIFILIILNNIVHEELAK